MEEFKQELIRIINIHGIDNKVRIPDFILANHLMEIIDSHIKMNKEVDKYYEELSERDHDCEDNCMHDDYDSYALASAGRGTDEDYGYYGD